MQRNEKNDEALDGPFEVQVNRTGISLALDRARALYEDAQQAATASGGDEQGMHDLRIEYQNEAFRLGSRPVAGKDAPPGFAVLLDKLGERLMFERRGVRLYDAVVQRWEQTPGLQRNALDALRSIRAKELEHFLFLQHVILELGGDPTYVTPSADVVQVMSRGIRDIVVDPRTAPSHWLQALLTAELADTDGWLLLGNMAAALGLDGEAVRFREAMAEEERHIKVVRGMLEALTLEEAHDAR